MEMKVSIDYEKVIPALYEDPTTKEFVCCNVCGATLYKHGLDPVRHRNGFCNIDKNYYKNTLYLTSQNILYFTEMVNEEEYLFFVHPIAKKKGRRKKWNGHFEYELDYCCPLSRFKICNLQESDYLWYMRMWKEEMFPLYSNEQMISKLQNLMKQNIIDAFMKGEYRKKLNQMIRQYPLIYVPQSVPSQVKVTYYENEEGQPYLFFNTSEILDRYPLLFFALSGSKVNVVSVKGPDSNLLKKESDIRKSLIRFKTLEKGETSTKSEKKLLRTIYSFLTDDKITFIYEKEDLERYYQKHPYNLGEATYYAKGGQHIFLPAFAPAYHIVLEKMVKLGLHYVDHFLEYEDLFHLEKTSMKDILGFPLKLERQCLTKDIEKDRDYIKIFQKVQKSNPDLLNRTHFSTSLLRFWMLKYEVNDTVNKRISLPCLKEIDGKDERRICGYLDKLDLLYFNHYMEYLTLYYKNKEIAHGKFSLTPEDLEEKYESMKEVERQGREAQIPTREERFQESVGALNYQKYTTDCWEDQYLLESEYLILSPTSLENLRYMGNVLHNCLATYSDSIIKGDSIILYLYKKTPEKKVVGAIEVNGRFISQALSFCNQPLDSDAKAFVKKWAHVYDLYFSRYALY